MTRPDFRGWTDLPDDVLAERLADGAGQVLLELRASLGHADGRALKDAGDRAAQDFLAAALGAARPDDRVLSEEAADDRRRLDTARVWIVDPLDGTREFSEEGRSDWAVHVALWERAEDDLTVGAVALPAQGRTLTSRAVPGRAEGVGAPRVVASRTRPPQLVHDVIAALGGVLLPMGSAGAKIAAVVLGDADVYVHAGGQYEWDSAAPVAVARAAGLHTSRIDGSPLRYNQPDVSLPDLVVCRPDLAEAVLRVTTADPAR